MKSIRSFLFIFGLFVIISCEKRELVPGEGVVFTENNFTAVLAKAKQEKKPIFLYIWWTECSVCKETKAEVFPDKELSDLLNGKFVNASQEYHASGAAELLKKYPAPVTPYYFFIKPDGSIIKELRGWQNAKTLVKEAQGAIGG